MEKTSGIPISVTGTSIWRGTNKTNGQLSTGLGFPYVEVGGSRLTITAALQAELTAAGEAGAPFGNGLWYDRNKKADEPNSVYAGIPTAAGAVPCFAGVLKYDAGYASSHPVSNKGILPHQKYTVVKFGYLRYKFGKKADLATQVDYTDIDERMCLFFQSTTGDPVFAAATGNAADGTPTLAGCTYAGKVVLLYPEEKSWLVKLDF